MELIKNIWHSRDLRRRILFTIGIILVFRIAAQIPVPGVNIDVVRSFTEGSQALGVFSILTGGSLSNFSIIMMGLSPFINASIIMQLMTVVVPSLEHMKKEEGEQGQRKIIRYSRWLTLPLAFLQSYGMILLIENTAALGEPLFAGGTSAVLAAMVIITAGTLFLMWLGELITEKGIGNGISLIIFAGIVSSVPGVVGSIIQNAALGSTEAVAPFIAFIVFTIITLIIVVYVMEAQRPIPLMTSGNGGMGSRSSLPIRILQAGMVPVIFAISLLTFPTVIATLFQDAESGWLRSFADFWRFYFGGSNLTFPNSIGYIVLYFSLILFFTFFYVGITFQPDQVSENLQKRGSFIPGVRPGAETADYIGTVSNRMNLWGGLFLGAIALSPLFFVMFTPLSQSTLVLSGAGLIIVVSVVLELIRQVRSRLATQDYDRLENKTVIQ